MRYNNDHKALVIGAGPSMTVPNIRELEEFEGVVICTNKSLGPTIQGLNRCPDVCVILDASHDVLSGLMPHHAVACMEQGYTHFLVATQCHKNVVQWLVANVAHDHLHFFHSSIPEELLENVNFMLKKFWDVPVIDSGGNAGLLALKISNQLGASITGMLGMEHSHKLDEKWTNEQAFEYKIIYAPEDHQTFAVTPSFQGYLNKLVAWVREHDCVNLTDWGWPYCMRDKIPLKYMTRAEFVKS